MRYIYINAPSFSFSYLYLHKDIYMFYIYFLLIFLDHLRCELAECFFSFFFFFLFFFFTTQYIYTIYSLLVLVHLRHVLAHHDIPLSWPFVVIDARAAGRSESRQVASRRADPRPKGGLCDCLAPT